MELGHLFKLLVVHSDVFTGSKFDLQQSVAWMRWLLEGYPGKPCCLIADIPTPASFESYGLALQVHQELRQDYRDRVTLMVVNGASVTVRSLPPVTLNDDVWNAIATYYNLQPADTLEVSKWTGLRQTKSKTLREFHTEGWPQTDPHMTQFQDILKP